MGPRQLGTVAGAAQVEAAEAKLWSVVATLEETAVLARHLASHADLDDDAAGQQGRTADWAAGLAESLRTEVGTADRMAMGKLPAEGRLDGRGAHHA